MSTARRLWAARSARAAAVARPVASGSRRRADRSRAPRRPRRRSARPARRSSRPRLTEAAQRAVGELSTAAGAIPTCLPCNSAPRKATGPGTPAALGGLRCRPRRPSSSTTRCSEPRPFPSRASAVSPPSWCSASSRSSSRACPANATDDVLHSRGVARRTFNSIESTADQAEAFVQQGRWVEAERHYRELIGQTHVINYEYDDWLRRLGEIYRHLGRQREAAFVYLYLHYFDMARVHFDDGRAAVRLEANSAEARRALFESQRKLEQGADDFEQVGELERAFDCFQILLKLGKESSQFENLAEVYVNCIRVLRDDNLKFYVLQYYEDFITLAHERNELHAAATLYQEAAAYAAR